MTVFIEGNAEFITNDGDKAPYTFQSIGHYNKDGSFRSSGAAFFSGDTTGKLDFLNNIVGIYKDETDERMEMAHSLCGNGSKRRRNINRRTIQIDEA